MPALVPLFLAGLAGSLHCIGMCGPILAAFSASFDRDARRSRALDFAAYHAGRLWTYALLGLIAGALGRELHRGSALVGWQRPLAIALSALVVLAGLTLLGLIPTARPTTVLDGCGLKRVRTSAWYTAILRGPGLGARLLLGAVMGFLPCALVYAALVLAASLGDPLRAAAGMLAFGLGTLPSLSAVLVAARVLPARLRAQGTRLAAVVLIATGAFMMARSILAAPDAPCPLCIAEEARR